MENKIKIIIIIIRILEQKQNVYSGFRFIEFKLKSVFEFSCGEQGGRMGMGEGGGEGGGEKTNFSLRTYFALCQF